MNTRQTILVVVAFLLVGAIGVWWYFGFTLDFMRFFAATPDVTNSGAIGSCNAPAGCTCQDVVCIQAPCNPVIVCPKPTGGMVQCSPDSQTVAVGGTASLTAAGGSGNYNWFAPEGSINQFGPNGGAAVPGTASIVYDKAGTKKVTVQSPRGDGASNVDSVACTVIVTP